MIDEPNEPPFEGGKGMTKEERHACHKRWCETGRATPPEGTKERQMADDAKQCGFCAFYITLTSDLGMDWGVCGNAKSPMTARPSSSISRVSSTSFDQRQTRRNPMVLEEYEKLRDELNYHTCHESSIRRTMRYPAYQKIVDLGKDIIPIILAEFDHYDQTDEEDWFPGWWAMSALHTLTGASPEITQPGVLRHMVKVWIKWGIENGHLAKDRPKYEKTPPIIYKGWIVVGRKRGEDSVLCPKRKPEALWEEHMGTAAWVSKIDAARRVDDGWWKKYAWILPTKEEADMVLDVLNEKIKNGECSDFNRPDKAWVEEIK